jgi:hypothetical protein
LTEEKQLLNSTVILPNYLQFYKMKKLFIALLISVSALVVSCNSAGNVESKKGDTAAHSNGGEVQKKDTLPVMPSGKIAGGNIAANTTEAKATAEICDCVNSSLKDISPRVQQIFIRAANSERPLQALQNEIVTISDKEQEELFVQLQRFSSDPQLQNCSEEIGKKYGMNPDDKAAQEMVLQAAKNNKDCQLVYALLKIGMQQQPGTNAGN